MVSLVQEVSSQKNKNITKLFSQGKFFSRNLSNLKRTKAKIHLKVFLHAM